MRREARRRAGEINIWEDKRFLISGAIIAGIIALIIGFMAFSNVNNSSEIKPNQVLSLEPGNDLSSGNTESASSVIGKTVEEAKDTNTAQTENKTNSTNAITNTNTNTSSAKNNANTISESKTNKNTNTNNNTNSSKSTETKPTNSTVEKEKKISIAWPVKGEILKGFSTDNLLFSTTLQEWTTHNGVDIKADKASVVSAASDGTVKSIKNDPRYGLTVTIEHENGYKTVYSNLLTAEFVVEGEKVKQGQNIATVGNTANFEVADDFHLHFEVLKDSEYVDPMIYLK